MYAVFVLFVLIQPRGCHIYSVLKSVLSVCIWVCLWVCYHDNSKLRASILTKLGL